MGETTDELYRSMNTKVGLKTMNLMLLMRDQRPQLLQELHHLLALVFSVVRATRYIREAMISVLVALTVLVKYDVVL